MEKQLFADYSAKQRAEMLRDNADTIEEKGYMKSFSEDEIRERKDDLAQSVIGIAQIQQEKKDANDEFKSRLKPLEVDKNRLLEEIKNKAEFVNEECYKMVAHDEGMVGYYNSKGELIESRPIRADEKQSTIFQMIKTGTND